MRIFKLTLDNHYLNIIKAPNYAKAVAIATYLYGLEVTVEEIQ